MRGNRKLSQIRVFTDSRMLELIQHPSPPHLAPNEYVCCCSGSLHVLPAGWIQGGATSWSVRRFAQRVLCVCPYALSDCLSVSISDVQVCRTQCLCYWPCLCLGESKHACWHLASPTILPVILILILMPKLFCVCIQHIHSIQKRTANNSIFTGRDPVFMDL